MVHIASLFADYKKPVLLFLGDCVSRVDMTEFMTDFDVNTASTKYDEYERQAQEYLRRANTGGF